MLEKARTLNIIDVETSLKEIRAKIQTVQSNIEKNNSLDKIVKDISDLSEQMISLQEEYETLSFGEPGKIESTINT